MRIVVIGTRGFPGIQGGVEKHCEHLYPLLSEKNDIIVCRRKPFLSDASSYQYPHICYKDFPSTRIKGFDVYLEYLYYLLITALIMNIKSGAFFPE